VGVPYRAKRIHQRSSKPAAPISLDELADGEESHLLAQLTPQEPLEKTISDRHTNDQALEALNRVPEPFRKILEMYFLQDLSYEVIADQLRIPQGTVMSRLHKARKLLQDAWQRQTALVNKTLKSKVLRFSTISAYDSPFHFSRSVVFFHLPPLALWRL